MKEYPVLAAALVVALVGCASAPPISAERRRLLYQAAKECHRDYPNIRTYEIDRFGQIEVTLDGWKAAEVEHFFACWRERARRAD